MGLVALLRGEALSLASCVAGQEKFPALTKVSVHAELLLW
jgi:hypothetical protein